MGNWNVSVEGVGCHHNGKPYDVEAITNEYVKQLKAAGHTVTKATVTTGSTIAISGEDKPKGE